MFFRHYTTEHATLSRALLLWILHFNLEALDRAEQAREVSNLVVVDLALQP